MSRTALHDISSGSRAYGEEFQMFYCKNKTRIKSCTKGNAKLPLKFQDFPVPLVRFLMFPTRHPKSFEEASCFYPSPQNMCNKQTPFRSPDGKQNSQRKNIERFKHNVCFFRERQKFYFCRCLAFVRGNE